ncbi:MAG: hypothetical protein ABR548_04635 [Actinomycetota bacterium]|nr:hypothetical protein [Actinomycetota bacterium]
MQTRIRRPVVIGAVFLLTLSIGVSYGAAKPFAIGCPAGYHSARQSEEERATFSQVLRIARRDAAAAKPGYCINDKHPESYKEFAAVRQELLQRELSPYLTPPPGALRRATEQRLALSSARNSVSGAAGSWEPIGNSPLLGLDPRYGSINGEGLDRLSGRVDSVDYDPATGRLFASAGTGGVWMSDDLAKTWHSISDTLPTQIIGAVAWSPSGALIAVSGEPLQAGLSHVGYGAFRTTDLGKTWQQAKGVPDEILGFQVAVDPTNPDVVYVATSKGLFRSQDAGATFTNVRLPTGGCAGKEDNQKCLFANMVTDVIVQGADKYGHKGGKVMAVVAYRAGARPFPQNDKVIESQYNGLFVSDNGKPGTFRKLEPNGFAEQERIGRTELGVAVGPQQNHDVVYAIVQDAEVFNAGYPFVDTPSDAWLFPVTPPTYLNGVYSSTDFGATWEKMGDPATISFNPATGSALGGADPTYVGGAQAWYNEWIKPDPTIQTTDGIPTRLMFGLEEIWQNDDTSSAATGQQTFHVIGKYYAGHACLRLDLPVLPFCPASRPVGSEIKTTTHPDQHDAFFIPDGHGGVTLIAGNDGGIFKQHAGAEEEFDNTKWGVGFNDGFHTLLPYDVGVAEDGVVWFGLQDNGSGKIDTDGKNYETFGGDGFWVAVDPNNSDYAWEEVTGASMRTTTDGGKTWHDQPPPVTGALFANPFVMDALDANHVVTAGNQVVETLAGPNTCTEIAAPEVGSVTDPHLCSWTVVFDLGTAKNPGVAADPLDPLGLNDDSPANSMSMLATYGDNTYVGYCGPCSLLNQSNKTYKFQSGIATNVGGNAAPQKGTSSGWHIAAAKGLPERMVTGVAIDPANPKNVTVTLGGYETREWRPPGSFGDKNTKIGKGHVFRSTDAGKTFTDISGDLPDAPAVSVLQRGNQIIAGTNIGAFISSDLSGAKWSILGNGLPAVKVVSMKLKPGDADTLIVATFGRGVYKYTFPKSAVLGEKKTRTKPTNLPSTGVATDGFAWVLIAVAGAMALRLRRRRLPQG